MSTDDKNLKIVISQPMLFPWVGLFEQMHLADIYVHYDDVQFSRGSFVNRVQIKTPHGSKWLTVPLTHTKRRLSINQLQVSMSENWQHQHLAFLTECYESAPHFEEMLALIEPFYRASTDDLAQWLITALEAVYYYFFPHDKKKFLRSSELGVSGVSDRRILDIVKNLNGTVYITGHGAQNYLNHEMFESSGILPAYMNYQCMPYPQLFGSFTPYISILDLIANMGQQGRAMICSGTVDWRTFTHKANLERA